MAAKINTTKRISLQNGSSVKPQMPNGNVWHGGMSSKQVNGGSSKKRGGNSPYTGSGYGTAKGVGGGAKTSAGGGRSGQDSDGY